MDLTQYQTQQHKAELFKTLGHAPRIRILEALGQLGATSVGDLAEAVGLEQSHMSQQLGLLRRASLVTSRREGSTVVYSLRDPRILDLLLLARAVLQDIAAATHSQLLVADAADSDMQ